MITLRYTGRLCDRLHKQEESLDIKNVSEALAHIGTYGVEAYTLAMSGMILLNKTNVALLKGRKTKLNDGDILSFLEISGGG